MNQALPIIIFSDQKCVQKVQKALKKHMKPVAIAFANCAPYQVIPQNIFVVDEIHATNMFSIILFVLRAISKFQSLMFLLACYPLTRLIRMPIAHASCLMSINVGCRPIIWESNEMLCKV